MVCIAMIADDPPAREVEKEKPPWWKPFLIFLAPLWLLGLLLLPIAMLISIPISSRLKRRMERQEKALKNQLKDVGRFVDWTEVESKLERGEGTLIVEYCFPKGPVREWWTEDDVIGNAPRALSDSTDADLDRRTDRLADYARSCVVRYVNLDSGIASITEPPEGLLWDWDRKLDEKYPRGRIVTLENMGVWQIAEGDMKFPNEPER